MRQTIVLGSLLLLALVGGSTVAESPSGSSAKAEIDLEAAAGWDLTSTVPTRRHSEVGSLTTYPGQGVVDPPPARSQSLYPGNGRTAKLTSTSIWPGRGKAARRELVSQSLYPGDGDRNGVTSVTIWGGRGLPARRELASQYLYPGSRRTELTSLSAWSVARPNDDVYSLSPVPGWVELLEISPSSLATPSGLLIGRSALDGVGPIPTRDGRLFVPVELLSTP